MNTSLTRIIALTVLAGSAALVGCGSAYTTAYGSEASFNRVSGNLTTTVEANLDSSWAAAQGALDEMQFTTESKGKDVMKAVLRARTADRSPVHLVLERRSENVTDVSISVSTMGKEATAKLVLDKMIARLQSERTTSAPGSSD
jgi:hypothetical protein